MKNSGRRSVHIEDRTGNDFPGRKTILKSGPQRAMDALQGGPQVRRFLVNEAKKLVQPQAAPDPLAEAVRRRAMRMVPGK